MAGETILCPPGPPLKGKPLILDVLAIPAVEGELHESSGSPRAIVKWGESSGSPRATVKWGESAGWICPPCGSLKALSRSAVHSVISSGARSAESRNLFIISSLSRFLHSLRSVEMTKKVLCRNGRRRQLHWDCLRLILSGAILMQTGQTKRRGAALR